MIYFWSTDRCIIELQCTYYRCSFCLCSKIECDRQIRFLFTWCTQNWNFFKNVWLQDSSFAAHKLLPQLKATDTYNKSLSQTHNLIWWYLIISPTLGSSGEKQSMTLVNNVCALFIVSWNIYPIRDKIKKRVNHTIDTIIYLFIRPVLRLMAIISNQICLWIFSTLVLFCNSRNKKSWKM
jgi:hypothetical protein